MVLIVALVGLLLLVAAERSSSVHLPADAADLTQTKFALMSLLIGAVVGAAWILPIWEERAMRAPLGWAPFFNYELGAASTLAALACVSAVRRREPLLWLVFLASAVAGMSLAVASLRAHAFVVTFLGWLLYSVVLTFFVSAAPELARLFADFLGVKRRRPDRVEWLEDGAEDPAQPSGVGERGTSEPETSVSSS
ncbi:hypothetical protein ASG94_04275 [Nocardioides sp. Soil805]|nr:hypothetical protein ASG94_04275 [Nocardioides sp. Soil805]